MGSSLMLMMVGAYFAQMNLNSSDFSLRSGEWERYKNYHEKDYAANSSLDAIRRTIYTDNRRFIDDFNERSSEVEGFSLAANHLADLSIHEVRATNGFRLGGDSAPVNSPEAEKYLESILGGGGDDDETPDAVDWRTVAGRVSAVKNQGSCGSCWAFSTAGMLEGQEYRKGNLTTAVDLSPQNLVDCVKEDAGCQGGIMSDALEQIKREGGIDDEKSYPYKGRAGPCKFNRERAVISDDGFAVLPVGDEEKLKQVVARFGPVSVAIDASSLKFQFYRKGIYYDKHCKNAEDKLDHAVLVVGYGSDAGKDFWIVKNSWGPKYGQKGYILMSRNRSNNCGIATVATIPMFRSDERQSGRQRLQHMLRRPKLIRHA